MDGVIVDSLSNMWKLLGSSRNYPIMFKIKKKIVPDPEIGIVGFRF